MTGIIERSSQQVVPMYKVIARIMNPSHQTIRGKLTITETNCMAPNKCKFLFLARNPIQPNHWRVRWSATEDFCQVP